MVRSKNRNNRTKELAQFRSRDIAAVSVPTVQVPQEREQPQPQMNVLLEETKKLTSCITNPPDNDNPDDQRDQSQPVEPNRPITLENLLPAIVNVLNMAAHGKPLAIQAESQPLDQSQSKAVWEEVKKTLKNIRSRLQTLGNDCKDTIPEWVGLINESIEHLNPFLDGI